MSSKLTQAEAERLLAMLKKSYDNIINFPQCGEDVEFKVIGDTQRDVFVIKIFRGRINPRKYNYGARIEKNGILLLELHINPSRVHINPDSGQKITGSHWHIYTEEYDRKMAYPADIDDADFIGNSIDFFKEFNIIEYPNVQYVQQLFQ